eukprot:TRINITY_DN19259_c0_g1_i1.p1 TRINITY_DN19259_c0_g1~~TRINITY_DN19259_c0_g1_i1.p1  ORF type:complete len:820 (+),score=128.17 TRINITY_DN19259_c0_g1_i1:29-2461(+)
MADRGSRAGGTDVFEVRMQQLSRRVEEWRTSRSPTPVKRMGPSTAASSSREDLPAANPSYGPADWRRGSKLGDASPIRIDMPASPASRSLRIDAMPASPVVRGLRLGESSPARRSLVACTRLGDSSPARRLADTSHSHQTPPPSVVQATSSGPGATRPAAFFFAADAAGTAHAAGVAPAPRSPVSSGAASPMRSLLASPSLATAKRNLVSPLSPFDEDASPKPTAGAADGGRQSAAVSSRGAVPRALALHGTPDFERQRSPASTSPPKAVQPELSARPMSSFGRPASRSIGEEKDKALRNGMADLSENSWERARIRLVSRSPSRRRDASPTSGLSPSSRAESPSMARLNPKETPFDMHLPRTRTNSSCSQGGGEELNDASMFGQLSYRGPARSLSSAAPSPVQSRKDASPSGSSLLTRLQPEVPVSLPVSPANHAESPPSWVWPGADSEGPVEVDETEPEAAARAAAAHIRDFGGSIPSPKPQLTDFSFEERMNKLQRHVQNWVETKPMDMRDWPRSPPAKGPGSIDEVPSSYAPSFGEGSPTAAAASRLTPSRVLSQTPGQYPAGSLEARDRRGRSPATAPPRVSASAAADEHLASRVNSLEESLLRIEGLLHRVVRNGLADAGGSDVHPSQQSLPSLTAAAAPSSPCLQGGAKKSDGGWQRHPTSLPPAEADDVTFAAPGATSGSPAAPMAPKALEFEARAGEPRFCSGCGSSYDPPDSAFCRHCGQKRAAAVALEAQVPIREARQSYKAELQDKGAPADSESTSLATVGSPPRKGFLKWPMDLTQAREELRAHRARKQQQQQNQSQE